MAAIVAIVFFVVVLFCVGLPLLIFFIINAQQTAAAHEITDQWNDILDGDYGAWEEELDDWADELNDVWG